jgi:hypothetical protein
MIPRRNQVRDQDFLQQIYGSELWLGFDEELEGLAEYEKYLTAGARLAERQRLRKAEDVREALENIYEEVRFPC